MAARALRWFDVAPVLALLVFGEFFATRVFDMPNPGAHLAVRAAIFALVGAVGFGLLGLMHAYYQHSRPLRAALRHAAIAAVAGAVISVLWTTIAG